MRVVNPVTVTASTLLSSSVPDDDAPAWIAGSYAQGERVVRDRHVYESLAADNTATPGAETTSPGKWQDLGPINRWRMFDKRKGSVWQIGTYTQAQEAIDVTIRPGRVVNAIGLVGVEAASVRVVMTAPDEGVVYDSTVSLADTSVISWYEYFFKPIERRDSAVLLDLPAYGNADVQIIVSAPAGVARVGSLVLGQLVELGGAAYPTAFGGDGYSTIKADPFGNMEIVARPTRDSVSFTFYADEDRSGSVRRLLRQLKDAQALYVGRDDLDVTIIAGRAEEPAGTLIAPGITEFRIEVRSLQ
tara:strand:- start:3328 stop:4233 length:906 start_codon:yes stop_codon:yes gene_type:complete